MMKSVKFILFLLTFSTFLWFSSSAFAVPYSINFDADGGAIPNETDQHEMYGWDMEVIGKETINGSTSDLVTHQQLGADGILNNGDNFYENLFLNISNGFDESGSPLNPGGTDGLTGYFNANLSEPLYADINLSGYIDNYNNGADGDTTATDFSKIENDSYDSIFTSGSVQIFADTNDDQSYTSGTDTDVATLSLIDSGPFTVVPGVFNSGASGTVTLGFQFDTANYNHFDPNFKNFQTFLNNGWLLTFAQESISLESGALDGDTSTNPDEILLGWQASGLDANFQAVPEPTTLLLFGTGLLGLAAFGRKKFMKKS